VFELSRVGWLIELRPGYFFHTHIYSFDTHSYSVGIYLLRYVRLYVVGYGHLFEGCLTVHLPHEIT